MQNKENKNKLTSEDMELIRNDSTFEQKKKEPEDLSSDPCSFISLFSFMILMLSQLYQNVSMKYIHTFSLFHRLL